MNPEFRTDISSVGRYGMHRDTQFISDFLIHLAIGYALIISFSRSLSILS